MINEHEFGKFLIEQADTLGAFIDTLEGVDDEQDMQAIKHEISLIKGEVNQRVDVINYMIKFDLEGELEKIKQIEQACKAKKEAIKRKQERLKSIVKETLETTGEGGKTFKAHLRKSESVEVFDEKELPDAYKQQTITYTPIKKDIKEALKRGDVVPGAALITKKSVVIK